MITVCTDCQEDRLRLEQDYDKVGEEYSVPVGRAEVLHELLDSVVYEYYHNCPPAAIEAFQRILLKALGMKICMGEYREAIALFAKEKEEFMAYREHFKELSHVLEQPDSPHLSEHTATFGQEDSVFEMAEMGEEHETLLLESTSGYQPMALGQEDLKLEITTDHTHYTFSPSGLSAVEESPVKKLSSFLSQPETFKQKDWNQRQDTSRDGSSSQLLTSFNKKKSTLLSTNDNLEVLMDQQERYDLNRQRHMHNSIKKHHQLQDFNYNQMMKGMLLGSKLRSRRKK